MVELTVVFSFPSLPINLPAFLFFGISPQDCTCYSIDLQGLSKFNTELLKQKYRTAGCPIEWLLMQRSHWRQLIVIARGRECVKLSTLMGQAGDSVQLSGKKTMGREKNSVSTKCKLHCKKSHKILNKSNIQLFKNMTKPREKERRSAVTSKFQVTIKTLPETQWAHKIPTETKQNCKTLS